MLPLLSLPEPLRDPRGPAAIYQACPFPPGWMASLPAGWPGSLVADCPASVQITATLKSSGYLFSGYIYTYPDQREFFQSFPLVTGQKV